MGDALDRNVHSVESGGGQACLCRFRLHGSQDLTVAFCVDRILQFGDGAGPAHATQVKLEPVYLVAPRESATRHPTRRVFLACGITAVGSVMLGGAGGYLVSRAAQLHRRDAVHPDLDPYDGSSGEANDETAGWLRRVADGATPTAELMGVADRFLVLVASRESIDPVMWFGVERIVVALIEAGAALSQIPPAADPRTIARLAAQIIRARAAPDSHLRSFVPRLFEVR